MNDKMLITVLKLDDRCLGALFYHTVLVTLHIFESFRNKERRIWHGQQAWAPLRLAPQFRGLSWHLSPTR